MREWALSTDFVEHKNEKFAHRFAPAYLLLYKSATGTQLVTRMSHMGHKEDDVGLVDDFNAARGCDLRLLGSSRCGEKHINCVRIVNTIMSAGVCRRELALRATTRGALLHPSGNALPVLSLSNMSQVHPIASSSSSFSNFQSVFDVALEAYEKKTKCKLLSHPLAAQLQSCDSPIAILSVLQDLTQEFDRRHSGDERLTNWLSPTVNVLYAFSDFIGQGVGLVSLDLPIFLEPVIRSSFFRYFRLQTCCFLVSASFFR